MDERSDEITFECKSKSDDGDAKVKDEIDFTFAATGRGLKVVVKYEQEIEVKVEDDAERVEEDDKPEDQDKKEEDDEDNEQEKEEEEEAEEEEDKQKEETAKDGDEERALQEAEQETETAFEVYFNSVIEYVKGDSSDPASSAFDWEKDTIVQTIDLISWNDFSSISTSGPTSTFEITSPDGKVGFSFAINRAAEGASMTANKAKIDFKLTDFPWTREDSYVALLSTVETEEDVDVKYDEDEDTPGMMAAKDIMINFDKYADASSLTPIGEYSWVETAEVLPKPGAGGVTLQSTTEATDAGLPDLAVPETVQVVATSPSYESERRRVEGKTAQSIAFSFVGNAAHQASEIFWDPTAGVSYSESSSAGRLAYAASVSLVGILSVLVALV